MTLVIRLVVSNPQNHMIEEVVEVNRKLTSGRRNLNGVELLLDKAQEAIDKGLIPILEFDAH